MCSQTKRKAKKNDFYTRWQEDAIGDVQSRYAYFMQRCLKNI